MAGKYLGDDFDIHGGGTDLIFPHHENEVAQSEGASGLPLARYWLHNGMVNLGGEKMAKSTGLVVDLASILETHGGRALRLLFLRAHYRSPIDYSSELLDEAAEALARLDRFRTRVEAGEPDPQALEDFRRVMDNDFSTSEAVSLLFDLVREGNRFIDSSGDASHLAGAVEVIVSVLGIDAGTPAPARDLMLEGVAARFGLAGSDDEVIENLINMRNDARADGRFAEADSVRDALAEVGVILEDAADGTRWVRR
jgi:cysteinyl-tRNA synthetase